MLIPRVVVRSRETNRDERLDPVDLRGKLSVIRVRALVPEGEKRRLVVIRYGAGGSKKRNRVRTRTDRERKLIFSGRAIDISISVRGYRTVERYGVSSDLVIQLEREP